MATLLPDLNIIYLAAPGTASTTLEWIFLGQLNGVYLDAPENLFRFGTRHAMPRELEKACDQGQLTCDIDVNFDQVRYVTSVRNPFAYHYAEWYRHRTKWIHLLKEPGNWVYHQPNKIEQIVDSATKDFSTYIVDRLAPLVEQGNIGHLNAPYVQEAEFFIRSEFLYEDLQVFLETLNVQQTVQQQDLNITPKSSKSSEYWREYSREARATVEAFNKPTLEKFGYAF